MIKALLNGILGLAKKLIVIVLTPINVLISNLFPSVASGISTFNNFVNTYIGNSLSYFFSMLPPLFRLVIFWNISTNFLRIDNINIPQKITSIALHKVPPI